MAGEPAAAFRRGRFADYAIISLHGLRIFLEESYEMIIDRLEVMPPILEVVGLEADDLPHPSTLNKWLDRIVMNVWRVLLRREWSAKELDPSRASVRNFAESLYCAGMKRCQCPF